MILAKKLIKFPKLWLVTAILLLAIGVASVMIWKNYTTDSNQHNNSSYNSLVDDSVLAELATTSTSIDRSHLSDGLTPPTNKWFSGFALQKEPKPGYNRPNSFKPLDNGFEFSLPKVTSDQKVITGTHSADIIVRIESVDSYKITYYDELLVELTYFDSSNEPIATVRLASGLPYIYVKVIKNTTISFSGEAAQQDSWTSIKSNGMNYGASKKSQNGRISLNKGSNVTFFSAPNEESLKKVAAHANTEVETTSVSYERESERFVTTFKYITKQDRPLLYARLPHHQTDTESEMTYQSILGDITTEVGNQFSYASPSVPVADNLDLGGITSQQRNLLLNQLKKDISDFEPVDDTYFGGKQLYRMAQLLSIASQLKANDLALEAKAKLKNELETWLEIGKNEPKSFLYDPSMKGIVGNEASFGSDKEFNDHHFHYGYFIYAAAILAQYDKDFLNAHKDTINLLVADIANYNSDENLPLRRVFDPYAGHSWASGIIPFADGNNQESTSEAINAWTGVVLWARQIENSQLEAQTNWMLSQEVLSTRYYWLGLDGNEPDYLSDFTSPLASVVWGGKRDYATFFSDEPNAKLAIQLIPLNPTMKKLYQNLPDKLFTGTSTDKIYGDYILMAEQDSTLDQALNLPASSVDPGNSRSYMYAYILAK